MTTPAIEEDGERRLREEGAVFAPTRVRGARGQRVLASLVVVALGGLIGVGALDNVAEPQPDGQQIALVGPSIGAAPASTTDPHRDSRPPPHGGLPTGAPHGAAHLSLMDLDLRPAGSHLFVHGDLYSLDIVRVVVKLEDSAGQVAARQIVDIPGGSTAFMLGAVPRFDAHFFLPDEVQADGYSISATALDAKGHRLVTVARPVARATAM
jgi:hypothetical protein